MGQNVDGTASGNRPTKGIPNRCCPSTPAALCGGIWNPRSCYRLSHQRAARERNMEMEPSQHGTRFEISLIHKLFFAIAALVAPARVITEGRSPLVGATRPPPFCDLLTQVAPPLAFTQHAFDPNGCGRPSGLSWRVWNRDSVAGSPFIPPRAQERCGLRRWLLGDLLRRQCQRDGPVVVLVCVVIHPEHVGRHLLQANVGELVDQFFVV